MSNKRFNIVIFTLLVAFLFAHSGVNGCSSGGCGGSSSSPSQESPSQELKFKNGDTLELRFEFNEENYFLYTYKVDRPVNGGSVKTAASVPLGQFTLTRGYGYFLNTLRVNPIVETAGEDVIFYARNNSGTSAHIVIDYDEDTLKGEFTATFIEDGTKKIGAYLDEVKVNGKTIDFNDPD